MPNLITCQCQHCKGNLAFDAAGLSAENCRVECPYCNKSTVLFVPAGPMKTMTIRTNETTAVETGFGATIELFPGLAKDEPPESIDKSVGRTSGIFVVVGAAAFVASIFFALGIMDKSEASAALIFVGGLVVLVQCCIVSILLGALAEILTRLKFMHVERFFGVLKHTTAQTMHSCGKCKTAVTKEQTKCGNCGAELAEFV